MKSPLYVLPNAMAVRKESAFSNASFGVDKASAALRKAVRLSLSKKSFWQAGGQGSKLPRHYHLSTQILIQYLGTSFLHIKEMHDAETELIGGNRTYFPLKMTLERIWDSKRSISFDLNTPMERPIFGLAYSFWYFKRQICTPFNAWNIELLKRGMCIANW